MNSSSSIESEQPYEIKRIISACLHQIDVDSRESNIIHISSDNRDLEGYLSDLLEEINSKEQKRQYEFLRETTEFYVSLKCFTENQDLPVNLAASNLASRLLDKEVDTDSKYGHLGKDKQKGHVKKGSFLQFLYREGKSVSYLGVKIEHQTFLDETDFKKKIGLSITNKIYKACKVDFDEAGVPMTVFVYDTNSKPSTYWWNDFLELREQRTDSHNTREASKEVIKVINGIKKDHPADHTILRNSIVGAFKQKGEMKYDEFVEKTVKNYEPIDKDLEKKLPEIVNKLNALPEKKKFDTSFNLVPSEVPFKRKTYNLTKEIILSVQDGVENLTDKVWSEKTASGQELVVIDSPEGFKQFKLRERK
ncbi:hypothetical protein [Vibrio crassostreae]|uniref:hypothetical protein n=1 Tax=Vibrio crassostreae TaxID=246167 RepID=UPI001B31736B|nr:hypothetical protein [Vibrio crassostreae]